MPQLELPVLHDVEGNHLAETAVRSSRSSFIETLALSGGQSTTRTAAISRFLELVWHRGGSVGSHVSGIAIMSVLWSLCITLPMMRILEQRYHGHS